MKPITFRCSGCGEMHEGLPEQAFLEPDYIYALEKTEKEVRAKTSDDLCMLDENDFFIRCVLQIPIVGEETPFGWGIWVSASKENFWRYAELFRDDRETEMVPWFGWVSNRLPFYDDTLKLKTNVYPQGGGKRPLVKLEPTNHLLSVHQQQGMPLDLAIQIALPKLHQET